jgi:5-methylcytosine-specific restriction endonuclease McrA
VSKKWKRIHDERGRQKDMLRRALIERDGPMCHWCHVRYGMTLDHLDVNNRPRTLANIDNFVLACGDCNSRRGNTPVERWRPLAELKRALAKVGAQ